MINPDYTNAQIFIIFDKYINILQVEHITVSSLHADKFNYLMKLAMYDIGYLEDVTTQPWRERRGIFPLKTTMSRELFCSACKIVIWSKIISSLANVYTC